MVLVVVNLKSKWRIKNEIKKEKRVIVVRILFMVMLIKNVARLGVLMFGENMELMIATQNL